jgi:hypothetical protein
MTQAIIIGLVIVAAFTALALGLYFGQNKRSARGDKSKVVRAVQGSPLDNMPTKDRSAREADRELAGRRDQV